MGTVIRYVALAIAICVGAAMLRTAAPSHRMQLDPADTAEWLGWFGVVGVLIALVQLIWTDNIARASRKAANAALNRVMEFEAATHLAAAADTAHRIVERLRNGEHYVAYMACQALNDELVRIEANFRMLDSGHVARIGKVRSTSMKARATVFPWVINNRPVDHIELSALVDLLEQARDELNITTEGLRAERGQAQ